MTNNRLILTDQGDGTIQIALQRPAHFVPEPAGGPIPFTLPLTDKDLEDLRWYLEDYLRIPVAVYQTRGAEIADKLQPWGEALFRATFGASPQAMRVYGEAMAAADKPDLLIISANPAFLGLPWELLRDPEVAAPLALALPSVDRSFAPLAPSFATPAGAKLRVLLVISRPAGLGDVGFRSVARPLMQKLAAVAGEVEVELLRPPTLAAMTRRLKQAADEGAPFHMLHFDGHGTFGTTAPVGYAPDQFRDGGPQGYLLFERENGGEHLVPAADMALAVEQGKVPLVLLNACRSATITGGAGPEAALATRLIQAGVASVVAMSHSVYVRAAAEFIAAFYEALFAGKTVSVAVAAGRRQLHQANLRPSLKQDMPLQDWLVPVHYARTPIQFPHLQRKTLKGTVADRLRAIRATLAAGEEVGDLPDILAPRDGQFVGRDGAFLTLETALRRERVALIHGPGGGGKTELAKAFARWWRDTGGLDPQGGVFFHAFEPGLASFGLDGVVNAIGLQLLGTDFSRIAQPEQRTATLLQALRQVRCLLVWDNVETLHSMPDPQGVTKPLAAGERAAITAFIAALRQGGQSTLILTSRTPEEWLGPLHRLELPGLTGQEATEYADILLAPHPAAASRRRHPVFADLMEYLNGYPLGMRLILPHLAHHDAATLLAGLRGQVPLPATITDGPARHASLEACAAYSLGQLPTDTRNCLSLLALMEGVADLALLHVACKKATMPAPWQGVDIESWREMLDAATAVGLLSPINGLNYHIHPALPALLLADWRARAGAEFAGQQAAAQAAMLTAHAEMAAALFEMIGGEGAEIAFHLLSLLRRSLGHYLALSLDRGDWDAAQTMLQPLSNYLTNQGWRQELQGWLDRARLATEGASGLPPAWGSAPWDLWLFVTGMTANSKLDQGDRDAAHRIYANHRELLVAAGDPASRQLAVCLHQLGRVAQLSGHLAAAADWYRQSLTIKQELGNRPGMASSYHHLGMVAQLSGDLATAAHWYRQSLTTLQELGDRPGMARSYHQLGSVAQRSGDLATAADWYHQSLTIKQELGDRSGMARSYHQLGMVAQHSGDLVAAGDWYRQSLTINEALGNRPDLALTYAQMGYLHLARNEPGPALTWTLRSIALFPDFPNPQTGSAPRLLARLALALGLEVVADAWRELTGADLPGVIADALPALMEQMRQEMEAG